MKQILWMLVLSLVSFSSWADDDEIRTCSVKLNKDFSIFVDYGENDEDDDSLSSMDSDDFDDDILYIVGGKKNSHLKLWADESDEGALFYGDLDNDKNNEIRIDFAYQSKKAQLYTGKFTYYLKNNGTWIEQESKVHTIDVGTKHALALIEEDDEDLHNLRCGPPPVLSLNICPYVPNTVQTNSVHNDLPHGALSVALAHQGSENYVQTSDSRNALFLSAATGTTACRNESGKFYACKLTNVAPIENWPPTLVWKGDSKVKSKTCGSKCELSPGSYDVVTVESSKTLVLKGGVYYINKLVIGTQGNNDTSKTDNIAIELQGSTEIHYKKIDFFESGVKINTRKHHGVSNDLLLVGHGEKSNFYPSWETDKKGNRVTVLKDNIEIHAYVYIDHNADLSDNGFNFDGVSSKLVGGATAHSISLSGSDNTIQAGTLDCYDTSPKIAQINIKPNNFHLTCEDNKYVDVEAFNDKGELMTEFDLGEKLISLESITSGQLSFSGGGFNTATNSFQFNIDSKSDNNYGPVPVKAELLDDSNVSDTSDVVFVPLKFNINDGKEIELIAGKEKDETEVTIKTLACTADGKVYTGNYDKKLTDAHLTGHSFAPGDWSDNQSDFIFSATFTGGVTSDLTLQFDDAGQYSGELIDTISCDDFRKEGVDIIDCPTGQTQQVKGELKFKARPWTFAICGYASNSGGDASGGDAFLPAGTEFDLTAKPIIYSSALDSYRLTQKAKADEFCKLPVTDNFFKNDLKFNSKVELSHSVATPPSADGGQDGSLSYAGAQNNYAGTSSILLSDISVTEVGSFNFAASGNDTSFYAGILGGIDIGQREIGRFYPAYFSIEKIKWTVEDDLGDKNYLGKPFEQLDVEVGAYALGSTSTLQNYHLFDPGLQASFAAKGDSVVNNELRFSADLSTIKWSAVGSDSYWILNDSDAQVTRSLVKTETVSGKKVMFTKPNGPFNDGSGTTTTDFGFTIGGSDPVSFSDASVLFEQAFPTQPTVRYGRMVMGSSGGTSEHTLNVPLRVEYWDGSAFVVNDDDDLSKLSSNASHVCKQILWQDDEDSGSDSALSGVSLVQSVSSGLYQGLQATPNSSNKREQARFWIMLDDTATTPVEHTSPQRLLTDVDCGASGLNQPWLQYNWRGQGDEDPSTVATFGIFRGNDKVIFRAEPNLVGN